MTTNTIKLPFSADDLRGKDIKFRIHLSDGVPPVEMSAEGNGVLSVEDTDEEGRYEAVIHSSGFDGVDGGPGTLHESYLYLDQRAADCLQVLEDGTLSCLDATLPPAD